MSTNRPQKVITYLLDNNKAKSDRLQIAYNVDYRFDCEKHYSIVGDIIRSLEKVGEAPPLDHYLSEYDYNWVTELSDRTPNIAEVRDLIEKQYKEQIKLKASNTVSKYIEGDDSTAEDFILEMRTILDKYDEKIQINDTDRIEDMYERRKDKTRGLKSFVEPVDELVGRLEPGTMSTLGGKSGQFKTTLAMSMLYRNVVELGKNVVFLSLEMARELILYNLLSRHSHNPKFMEYGIDPILFKEIKEGELSKAQEEHLFEVVKEDLNNNDEYGNLVVMENTDFEGFTLSEIRSKMARFDFDVDGIILDYAQTLKYEDHPFSSSYTDPINYYVRTFSKLTSDVDGTGKECHVMLLSQVTKKGYSEALQQKGKYDQNALSEAHLIERESSYIWFTFAPDELKDVKQAKVFLAKNRYGDEMLEPEIINVDAGKLYVSDNSTDDENALGNIDVDDIL